MATHPTIARLEEIISRCLSTGDSTREMAAEIFRSFSFLEDSSAKADLIDAKKHITKLERIIQIQEEYARAVTSVMNSSEALGAAREKFESDTQKVAEISVVLEQARDALANEGEI